MDKQIAPSREAIEDAMSGWRDGYKQTRRPNLPAQWRAEYLAAVDAVYTTDLQKYGSMAELVAAYYRSPSIVDAAVEQVMYPTTSRHILNASLIEDAAYFRRAQQLLRAAGGEGGE